MTHVPSAVARSTLWIHLFFGEKWGCFSEVQVLTVRIFRAFPDLQWCQFTHDLSQFSRDETQNPFSLQSLTAGLSKRLWFVPCHLVCCWVFGACLKPFLQSRLNFKYQPKAEHVCTESGPLFKEHLGVSHLTWLCLSSPFITEENNINASLTFFRYCEAQCTTRGDVLGYYSNRGHRS